MNFFGQQFLFLCLHLCRHRRGIAGVFVAAHRKLVGESPEPAAGITCRVSAGGGMLPVRLFFQRYR